jgi:Transposase DDE domain group 1
LITDQRDDDLAALEARHRAHAIVEDRVRELKSAGLSNLPFSAFAPNQAWLEAALCAHDLTVWTQLPLFDGEHAVCEPKRQRYRLLHVAGKLTRHARRLTLHLPPTGRGPPPSPARSKASPPCPPERPPSATTMRSTRPRRHPAQRAQHSEHSDGLRRHVRQRTPQPATHAHSPKR